MNLRRLSLLCPFAAVGLALLSVPSRSFAQSGESLGAIVASLREDFRVLEERTRLLTAEIQQLKRENQALREQASANSNNVTVAQFNSAIAELERALRAGDKEVAAQLTQNLEKLAKQTKDAIDTLARAGGGSRASTTPDFNFSTDYPSTGVPYTVQPGDTIASIAQKFGSTIRDIQNANKIADARTLQAGQTIFVPQRK